MTIFVEVLVTIIQEHLSKVTSDLLVQSTAIGYDHNLSLAQKKHITELSKSLTLFASKGSDDADAKAIIDLLTAARRKVEDTREALRHARSAGKTVASLDNLIKGTANLYTKLDEFSFKLIDIPCTRTPEHIVYYHSCNYFAQEIFAPKAHGDVDIRTKKEACLAIRLRILKDLVKENPTLKGQQDSATQVLDDLANDNNRVTQRTSTGPAIPGISLFGFQLVAPSEWFAAGKGRFAEQLEQAKSAILAMTLENSDCPLKKAVAVAPLAVVHKEVAVAVHKAADDEVDDVDEENADEAIGLGGAKL